MMKVIRTIEEIASLHEAAQTAAFAAEDAGDTDEHAEGVYATLQWLTGNTDNDPMAD